MGRDILIPLSFLDWNFSAEFLAVSVLLRQPTGQRISKVRKQQKKFQFCQSYSYVNRKVWYHQIWIPNNLGFMVLILIYIPGDFVMPWIKMKKCIWNLCWRLYLSKNRELHSLSAEVVAASEAFCMPDAQFFLKQVFYAKGWKFRVCYLLPSNFNIINKSK